MLILNELPEDSEFRNMPLYILNAKCKHINNETWREIETRKMKDCSFNQLDETWRVKYLFKV